MSERSYHGATSRSLDGSVTLFEITEFPQKRFVLQIFQIDESLNNIIKIFFLFKFLYHVALNCICLQLQFYRFRA